MRKDNIIPHLVFREDFRTEHSVLDNDMVIQGSPTISNGVSGCSASDYLQLENIKINTSGAIRIILSVVDWPGTSYFLLSDDSDVQFYWIAPDTMAFKFIAATLSVFIANVKATYLGQDLDLVFSWDYDGANTTLTPYVNGVVGTPITRAGIAKSDPFTLDIFKDNDAIGSLKTFEIYDTALTENDALKLYNGTFSRDLLPEESRLFLPCKDSYVNGSGDRVTSILGTTITEATLGNGTTSTTFPTLESDNLFSFDGGDYINCGDNDGFSFTVSQPFSIGCFISLNSLSLTRAIISKARGTLTEGEFTLFVSGYKFFMYFIDDSAGAYKRVYTDDIRTYLNEDQFFSLIVTYDGSGVPSLNTVGIYVDGVNRTDTSSTSGAFVDMENTSQNLMIGIHSNLLNPVVGKIGHGFIIPTCLSPLQVQMLDKQMKMWRQI